MTARVSLADVEPDLVAGAVDGDFELLRRVLTLPRYEIPLGQWTPDLLQGNDGTFGLLLLEGVVVRDLHLAGRRSAQLFGAGDVVQACDDQGVLETSVTWTTLQPSAVVALGTAFSRASQRWPHLSVNLHRRLLDQADRLSLLCAISQLPRVDQRILALFSVLAERWGRVTPAGIVVPLPLTHEAVGRLIGAKRPTVSVALHDLGAQGLLARTEENGWLLSAER